MEIKTPTRELVTSRGFGPSTPSLRLVARGQFFAKQKIGDTYEIGSNHCYNFAEYRAWQPDEKSEQRQVAN